MLHPIRKDIMKKKSEELLKIIAVRNDNDMALAISIKCDVPRALGILEMAKSRVLKSGEENSENITTEIKGG